MKLGWHVERGALELGVTAIAIALAALAALQVASSVPGDQRVFRGLVEILIVGVPVAAGLYAVRSPANLRFGVALIAAGLLWSLTALGEADSSLPYSIGRLSAWTIFPVIMYLMLAFPAGRLERRLDRILLGGITALIVVPYAGSALLVDAYPTLTPWASCDAACPDNAFMILNREPDWVPALIAAREVVAVLLLCGVIYSIGLRARAASPYSRHAIMPVFAMSVVSIASLALYLMIRRATTDGDAVLITGQLWSLTIPGIAAAFFIGLARQRMMLGAILSRLSVALSHRLDISDTRATLASALGDAKLELLLPEGTPGQWRYEDGHVTSAFGAAVDGRPLTVIEDDDGVPVVALVHKSQLLKDDELATALRALIVATLQHRVAATKLEESLVELAQSRMRIARAADLERTRIEHDLHDGAQQRLVGLRIKLSIAEDEIQREPTRALELMRQLGSEIELALEELRALAHGVYPSLLIDRGLEDALRSVAVKSPLRANLLTHGVTRLPAEVETAVYFACLEAIQNATKHADGATAMWLSLHQNASLTFELRDDGPGFTPPPRMQAGGLRNMRDRVEALGGQLTVQSAPGRGTRISGIIPLDRGAAGPAGRTPRGMARRR